MGWGVPFSNIANTGGGADLGVWRGTSKGALTHSTLGQIKLQRPGGY